MSGSLDHSPARIIRELLIDLSSGSATASLDNDWAILVNNLPDTPDSALVVNDTTGILDGRSMIDGEVLTNHGIQLIIRDDNQQDGYAKANDIAIALDGIRRNTVIVESSTYLVHAVSRKGDVIYLGVDVPRSNLHLYSINGTVSLNKTS